MVLSALVALFILNAVVQGRASARRVEFIDNYRFPDKVKAKILEQHPHLNSEQADKVIKGLREYFHICNEAGRNFVSMPSEAVDTAWHEFILFTRDYKEFCGKAFGKFLHHTPAEGMRQPKKAQKGIKTAWRLSCARENISASAPVKLPLLFSMDTALGIENGFAYDLDCENAPKDKGVTPYCASHISQGTGCGGIADGATDGSASDGGASAGCGSGCGGGCGS